MPELAIILSSSLQTPPAYSSSSSSSSPRRSFRLLPGRSPLLRCNLAASSSSDPSTRRLLTHYARLASKLALDGRLNEFLSIAESVLSSDAIAAHSPLFLARVDARMVSQGIFAVLRGGDLDRVIEFLKGAERLGLGHSSLFDEFAVKALRMECVRLVERGRLEEFVRLVEILAEYHFFVEDIVDPNNILRTFIQRRDVDMAVRYANLFPHSQRLLCFIMNEFGQKRDLESAKRVFEATKQKGGNMSACCRIIDICGLCGDLLSSRSIFEELLSQKITPNTYMFNSLMNVNACDLGYTLDVFKHMQDLGVKVDISSYNIILKACCNAKRVDLAQKIYKDIKDLASLGGLEMDVITYSTMIKVFADAKLWQMALNIKEDMLLADVSPNIVTWSSLISAFANAGQVDSAVQMFEEMVVAGCEPDAQSCNILLHACVGSCQYDRAFRLFYTWKESGFRISQSIKGRGCHNIDGGFNADNLNKDGSSHSAYISHPKSSSNIVVVPFRPTVATYNILMKACGSDQYRAKGLLDEMKMMGLSPNHISWSTLIDIYGTSRNLWGAIQAFRIMRDDGVKLDVIAYTAAIKACVENKNPKIAFFLFEEMKRYRLQPNQVTYNTLLRARSTYGSLQEVRQCLAIYQEMRKAGYNSNDFYLKELIEEWCEGVISCSIESRDKISQSPSHSIVDTEKTCSLLIEKVATHLQRDGGKNQAIDVRGLSKVEARIVVLSVLRMIKERYQLGEAIKDDMLIISGAREKSTGANSHEFEVQLAIIKVLQNELGLEVVTACGAAPLTNINISFQRAAEGAADHQKAEMLRDRKYQARRPQEYGLIRVTNKSLEHWLQIKNRQ